jgi:hypothetical protein
MTEIIIGSSLIVFGLGCFFKYEMIVTMILMVVAFFGLGISTEIQGLRKIFKVLGIIFISFGAYVVFKAYFN